MGWKIFKHAIKMLFGNFGDALRISALPWILTSVISYYVLEFIGSISFSSASSRYVFIALWLLILVPQILAGAWIAIGWHRFILKSEYPKGIVPRLPVLIVWRYIIKLTLIFLALLAATLPIFFFIWLVLLSGQLGIGLFSFLAIGALLLFGVISLRFGLILPAISIGQPLSLREAWAATDKFLGAIFIILLLSGLVTAPLNGIERSLASNGGAAVFIWAQISLWIQVMISASVLTTLYGHLIEQRSLD